MAKAALEHIRAVDDVDQEVRTTVVAQYEGRLRYRECVDSVVGGGG